MNNNLLLLKIKQRLNKLSSFDYDNIECWQVAEAFNKALLEWVRRQLHGINATREGAESSLKRITDLQQLLTPVPVKGFNKVGYFETEELPADFLEFSRLSAQAENEDCSARPLNLYLAAEADVNQLLLDEYKKPDFTWAESFFTFLGNRIRIYRDGFEVKETELVYYRTPVKVQFEGCTDPSTGTVLANQECEFRDDITELIIDEAVAILAYDLELATAAQRASQNAEKNN